MPIPYTPVDMKKIVEDIKKITPEESERRYIDAVRRGRADLLQWLVRYDSQGRLKPEFENDLKYLDMMQSYEFLSMTPDERAAYIVSEKKRLGVL